MPCRPAAAPDRQRKRFSGLRASCQPPPPVVPSPPPRWHSTNRPGDLRPHRHKLPPASRARITPLPQCHSPSCTEHTMQQSAAHLLAAAAMAVACLCLALSPSAHAQGTSGSGAGATPSCAAKLVPCAGYLNSTSTSTAAPAATCCGPLRDAAANETACLCAMLLNRAALRAFGVAPEQGLVLAKRCNVTTDASACSAGAGGASTGGSTAASSASTGSAASSSANEGGMARRLSLTGASSLLGFSFIWLMIVA